MTAYSKIVAGLVLTTVTGSISHAGEPSMNPLGFFSAEYREARRKFLRVADKAGAVLEAHENPAKGPNGEGLFTDVATLGPSEASNVLIIVSGTHGVEGFCGSGIQAGLLSSGLGDRLPKDTKIVFIHALNPYGMAWLRRVNEDNVDLNRNFVNFLRPPQNLDYAHLAGDIAPKDCAEFEGVRKRLLDFAERTAQCELRKLGVQQPTETLQAYAAKLGELRLRTAIHRGQYTHPKGLLFGGESEVRSNVIFRKTVKQHVIGASRVVLLDLHTGLGPYGHGTIILNEAPESEAYGRARAWWGNTVESTKSKTSLSSDIPGSLKYAFVRMLPEETQVTAVTLEFGTFDSLEVFCAMQAENWSHHHSKPNDPRSRRIKQEMLRVYYPNSDKHWLKMVWSRANFVVDRVFANM